MSIEEVTPKKEKRRRIRSRHNPRKDKSLKGSRVIGKIDLTVEADKKEIEKAPCVARSSPTPSSQKRQGSEQTPQNEIRPVKKVKRKKKRRTTVQNQQNNDNVFDPSPPSQNDSQTTKSAKKSVKRKKKRKAKACSEQQEGKAEETVRPTQKSEQLVEPTEQKIFYAVKNGAYGYNGVHTDWIVCARYLKDTCGATLKSFGSLDEAFAFAHGTESSVDPTPRKKARLDKGSQFLYVRKEKPKVPPAVRSSEQKSEEFDGNQTHGHGCRLTESPEPLESTAEYSVHIPPTPRNQHPSDHTQAQSISLLEEGELPEDEGLPQKGEAPEKEKEPAKGQLTRETDSPPATEVLIETPSPEEPRSPEGIVSPEVLKPRKQIRTSGEVQVQPWKVEPLLLPSTFLSSRKRRPIKKERAPLPVNSSEGSDKRHLPYN